MKKQKYVTAGANFGGQNLLFTFYVYIYPSLHHEQDVTQGQFFSIAKLVGIQNFASPRLVD